MADEIYIDPRFAKPPYVVDVRDAGTEDGTEFYNEGISWQGDFDFSEDLIGDTFAPTAPVSFTLVSQTVRTSSDGTQVVDVVLDLPDQEGVTEYEIRVAKK